MLLDEEIDCAGKPTGVWRYASELALDLELSDENEELLTFKCSGIGDTPDPDGVVVPDGVLAVVTEIPVGIGGAGARVFVVFVVVVFAVAVAVAVELEFNGVTAEADEIEADLDDLTLDCSLLLLLLFLLLLKLALEFDLGGGGGGGNLLLFEEIELTVLTVLVLPLRLKLFVKLFVVELFGVCTGAGDLDSSLELVLLLLLAFFKPFFNFEFLISFSNLLNKSNFKHFKDNFLVVLLEFSKLFK